MTASFADSNILLYLQQAEEPKSAIAERIVEAGTLISVQVLNEIVSAMSGKWRRPWDDIERFLSIVRHLIPVRPIDVETHARAVWIARRHKLHIYDSTIVASALLAGCDTLYSEDMHHGLVVEGRLKIVNPFRA
jgi:predicted nucleic acid-binding protein